MKGAAPFMPPYAHRPGVNARHPEHVFADVKAGLSAGMEPDDLAASRAWRTGWAWLDAGYFWEAHEVWEPVWLACPPNSAERFFMAALIQLANGRLKLAMNRRSAALRIARMGIDHIREARIRSSAPLLMGISVTDVEAMLADLATGVENAK